MSRPIMPRRCSGCIAPEGFEPTPETSDFKTLVERGEMPADLAVWACFMTCTQRGYAEGTIQGCRGAAEFFGVVKQ